MDALLRDLRLAARLLRRRAGFSALAIGVLALAIGASTAIFSVVNGVLLQPPAFEDPGRLVMVWERHVQGDTDRNVAGPWNFVKWRERNRSFTDLAAFLAWQSNLSGAGDPERVEAGIATGNLFAVLGARPLIGRALEEADSRPEAPDVAVLSESFWRRRFGGDPAVVGRAMTLDGQPTTVVGVMPSAFQVPPGVSVWMPYTLRPTLQDARAPGSRGRWMTVVARLRPDVTLAQARDDMARVSAHLAAENPEFDSGWTTAVHPLHADLVRDVRPALLLLMGAVGLLLLVACANVANLLLARAVGREREVAIRSALGAGPADLLRQFLVESLLLGLAGGGLGVVLAVWGVQGLKALLPLEVRLMSDVGLDARVLAFAAGVSVLSAVVFGLVPALQQARPTLVPALKEGGTVRGAGRGQRRVKAALVVGEVALSLVLTAGTGLLLRSFWKLTQVDPGFDPRHVLSASVDLPRAGYREPARQTAFFHDAVERLARLPGVRAAGGISWAPMGRGSNTSFVLRDRPAPPPGQEPSADVRIVTPGLFAALAIPLSAGRDFRDDDRADRPTVVIVNRALAQQYWPGKNPLGQRLAMEWGETLEAEVVGVVGDVRLTALDTDPRPTLYWHHVQVPSAMMTFMVRTSGAPLSAAPAVRAQVAALDPNLPVGRTLPLEEIVSGSVERPRFLLRLLAVFALIAVGLATVGVYGVMSYTVLERVPEVGIRLAVGATPGDIMRLMLRDGLALALAGIGIGLAAASAMADVLKGLLFEVAPRDPVALAAVSAVLLLATMLAAWLPARQAGRIDPIKALRAD
jgi:putative ABC transport system permease protein